MIIDLLKPESPEDNMSSLDVYAHICKLQNRANHLEILTYGRTDYWTIESSMATRCTGYFWESFCGENCFKFCNPRMEFSCRFSSVRSIALIPVLVSSGVVYFCQIRPNCWKLV